MKEKRQTIEQKIRDEGMVPSLSDQVAAAIRSDILEGHYHPGDHLSEVALCSKLDVSRNTLREAFRSLTKDNLLQYHANRGVFVTVPDLASIMDVYNVRRIIEVGAIAQSRPTHPALLYIEKAVDDGERFSALEQWQDVGTADIHFHHGLVLLADSQRLSKQFSQLVVELRLIFGLINDSRYLHTSFIATNRSILQLLQTDKVREAAELLKRYLMDSERMILAAYAKRKV
ncbi:GntR family transcriptional regulator [Bartonella sp. LJL80]